MNCTNMNHCSCMLHSELHFIHHHKIKEQLRLGGISGDTSAQSKVRQDRLLRLVPSQVLSISIISLGNLLVFDHPQGKKSFSHLNEIYLCFGLCELNRQDCSVGITKQSLPSPPSLPPTPQQVFIHVDKISLSLPMQNKPSSLSLSSYEKMLQVPNHLHGPLLDSSSMSMSLSCWGAQNWTQDSRCDLTRLHHTHQTYST